MGMVRPTEFLSDMQLPPMLPQSIDPQIRSFMLQLQIALRGWTDEATRRVNQLMEVLGQFPPSAGTPASLVNGQVWYDTTTHQFKGYRNGVVVTFTAT